MRVVVTLVASGLLAVGLLLLVLSVFLAVFGTFFLMTPCYDGLQSACVARGTGLLGIAISVAHLVASVGILGGWAWGRWLGMGVATGGVLLGLIAISDGAAEGGILLFLGYSVPLAVLAVWYPSGTQRELPTSYRLTHSELDFFVDVTVHERDGRYLATVDRAEDTPDVGTGDTPQEAVRAALRSFG